MLIDEIIELLGDSSQNLTEALLKTKILLHQISKKELVEWVNSELNGYSEEAALPGYRVIRTRVLANVSNPAMRYTSHPIPIGHLKPKQREPLEKSEIRDALAVVVAQNVRNEITNRDIGKLAKALSEVGIRDDDILQLEEAMRKDQESGMQPSFNGETGRWYTRLLARAAEGGLGVGIDIVTDSVAKILGSYFGSP